MTVSVVAVPAEVPLIRAPEPTGPVAGATVEVAGTGIRAVTDTEGQAKMSVPPGVQTFRVTPPANSPLKRGTYRETLEKDAYTFPLSPVRELVMDHTPEQEGLGKMPLVNEYSPLLGQLCQSSLRAFPEAEERALGEITEVVSAAGADTADLERRLAELAVNPYAKPTVTRADADGDGKPDLLVTFGWCQTPVILYRAAEPVKPLLLPTSAEDRPLWSPGGGSQVEQVADVNGDGVTELVATRFIAGASSGHTLLYVYQWNGTGFDTLFYDHLTDWVGKNRWSVGEGTVSIQCHPFGPYEHKMMEHRQLTETYRWNAGARRYELAERTIEPVASRVLQVSAAERLFQQGDFAGAAEAFRQVENYPVLNPRPEDPDWVAYAHLRLGQIDALADGREAALAELDLAAQGQGDVATAAAKFREGYRRADAAEGFQALWEWVRQTAFPSGAIDVVSDAWPYGLEPHTLGARPVMEMAFARAGRPLPADLPKAQTWDPADCLQVTW